MGTPRSLYVCLSLPCPVFGISEAGSIFIGQLKAGGRLTAPLIFTKRLQGSQVESADLGSTVANTVSIDSVRRTCRLWWKSTSVSGGAYGSQVMPTVSSCLKGVLRKEGRHGENSTGDANRKRFAQRALRNEARLRDTQEPRPNSIVSPLRGESNLVSIRRVLSSTRSCCRGRSSPRSGSTGISCGPPVGYSSILCRVFARAALPDVPPLVCPLLLLSRGRWQLRGRAQTTPVDFSPSCVEKLESIQEFAFVSLSLI